MLTDTKCRAAKPREKAFKMADGGGLFLFVTPSGSKSWRLAYRFLGKQKLLVIGQYPVVSLAEARLAREEAKKLLAQGGDPSQQKKIDRIVQAQRNATTFKSVAEELLAKMEREGKADATLEKKRWMLLDLASPLAGRPVADISAPELLAVLRKVEARGKHETAKRLRSACGQVFRYAVATGRALRDPSGDLKGALTAPVVKHRAAMLDPEEI
ncbi:MAG: integrase arm-type DNA-binding domain-containing protein, partial [Caulobacterales bacterium]|nr:integrase arm-type DNA-binding domain-containing protein [Caulobacterales bacterium]